MDGVFVVLSLVYAVAQKRANGFEHKLSVFQIYFYVFAIKIIS